ncbi:MAG: hypothetical protein RIQ52_1306 [Pseudomonadota bacterium]|jgi:hypothetical protein
MTQHHSQLYAILCFGMDIPVYWRENESLESVCLMTLENNKYG